MRPIQYFGDTYRRMIELGRRNSRFWKCCAACEGCFKTFIILGEIREGWILIEIVVVLPCDLSEQLKIKLHQQILLCPNGSVINNGQLWLYLILFFFFLAYECSKWTCQHLLVVYLTRVQSSGSLLRICQAVSGHLYVYNHRDTTQFGKCTCLWSMLNGDDDERTPYNRWNYETECIHHTRPGNNLISFQPGSQDTFFKSLPAVLILSWYICGFMLHYNKEFESERLQLPG